VFELFLAYSSRSNRPFWTMRFLGNPWLLGALAVPLVFHALLLFTPLAAVFDLVTLSLSDVLLVLAISLAGFLGFEGMKVVMARK